LHVTTMFQLNQSLAHERDTCAQLLRHSAFNNGVARLYLSTQDRVFDSGYDLIAL